jgi:hypothetical protein
MASEIENLRLAIIDLTVNLKSGGKGTATPAMATPAMATPAQAASASDMHVKATTKATSGFSGLAAVMGKFALGLASVGTVLKGLSGTREGYHLDYAMNHIFFEIADMMRGPIRFITNELEGLARVLHYTNKASGNSGATAGGTVAGSVGWAGAGWAAGGPVIGAISGFGHYIVEGLTGDINRDKVNADALKDTARLSDKTRQRHPDIAALSDAETDRRMHPDAVQTPKAVLERQAREGKLKGYNHKAPELPGGGRGNDHIQPILTTSFGDVAGLQAKLQALSTENPAQERGLSLIETIAKAVLKMAYGQAEADKAFPETIKKD